MHMVEKPKTSWEYVPKAKRVVKSRVKDLGVIFIECLRAKAKRMREHRWEQSGTGRSEPKNKEKEKVWSKKRHEKLKIGSWSQKQKVL